ncbi:MAG: hypothetical protein ABW138_09015, partial [Candidatus Thiodiazotropha sp. 4PDIVS1]
TGISAIIGPHGEFLSRSALQRQDVLQGEILPMSGLTPYARVGNLAVLIMLIVTLVVNVAVTKKWSGG